MKKEAKGRGKGIEIYEQTSHAGLTCLRCGISRSTMRKWWEHYLENGKEDLTDDVETASPWKCSEKQQSLIF